ncbi:hypothetical protein P2318_14775 [Myxococcaceae bacterium GXIMD 01537]
MKIARRFLFLSLSLLAMGCGGTDGEGDGDGNEEALQCTSVSLCTNWDPDDDTPVSAPPLSGGTIANAMYRLEQGQGSLGAVALIFKGSSILLVDDHWSNALGKWSASGSTLSIQRASSCGDSGDGTLSSDERYEYAVRGDELFIKDVISGKSYLTRWKKVGVLCTESSSFKCRGGFCVCEETTNKPLTGKGNCY